VGTREWAMCGPALYGTAHALTKTLSEPWVSLRALGAALVAFIDPP